MRLWVVGLWIAVTLSSTGASAYEQRSGTFSMGVQGQISGLFGAETCRNCLPARTDLEDDGLVDVDYALFELDRPDEKWLDWLPFLKPLPLWDGTGLGLTVRFRYAIDRRSALGISFEAFDFERTVLRSNPALFEMAANDTANKIHATLVTADYYRYFFRKAKQTPYLVVGVGFYRPEIRWDDEATSFPGSNLALSIGGGGEHFFTRSVSLEASLRFYGLFHDGGPSYSSQLALGLRFYHIGGRRRR